MNFAEQELVCNVGSKTNASDFFAISAKVSNLVTMASNSPRSPLRSPQTGPRRSKLLTCRRSRHLASQVDISKNSVALVENLGYIYGPTNDACPWAPTKVCKLTAYTALLSAPAGGKGAMPAIGDITFTDDLLPRAMYPGLQEEQYQRMEADLERYGSRIYPFDSYYWAPAPKIGSAVPRRSTPFVTRAPSRSTRRAPQSRRSSS